MALEPPYGTLRDELKEGRIVVFLGAGASLSGRPNKDVIWNEQQSPYLPKGSELADWLAKDSGFPSRDPVDRRDLAKVASYFESTNDRPLLRKRLRQVFGRKYPASAVHRFLAEIEKPMLIVTTNYDNLIEQALEDVGKAYHLVVHTADQKEYAASVLWWKPAAENPEAVAPMKLHLSLEATTIIYKMHGSVNRKSDKWDNFVITEEDYMDFLSRMTAQAAIPARLMKEFRERRFLFLGYALGDWNLRVILRNLRTALIGAPADSSGALSTVFQAEPGQRENLKSWAIQLKPSELEKWLWNKRQVDIYDMRIEDFVAKLSGRKEVNP